MTEQSTNDTSEDLRPWRRRILFTVLSIQIALPIQQNNAAHADPMAAAQTDLAKNTSATAAIDTTPAAIFQDTVAVFIVTAIMIIVITPIGAIDTTDGITMLTAPFSPLTLSLL